MLATFFKITYKSVYDTKKFEYPNFFRVFRYIFSKRGNFFFSTVSPTYELSFTRTKFVGFTEIARIPTLLNSFFTGVQGCSNKWWFYMFYLRNKRESKLGRWHLKRVCWCSVAWTIMKTWLIVATVKLADLFSIFF